MFMILALDYKFPNHNDQPLCHNYESDKSDGDTLISCDNHNNNTYYPSDYYEHSGDSITFLHDATPTGLYDSYKNYMIHSNK